MNLSETFAEIRRRLQETGKSWHEIRGGLAIDFDDGFDASYVTEIVLAGVPSGESSTEIGEVILNEHDRLNQARGQVLNGLRHYAAEKKVAIQPGADGRWNIHSGGAIAEIDVGPPLTQLLREQDSAESLRQLIKQSCFLRAPSPKRALRLVALDDSPKHEISWKEEVEKEPTISPQALAMDCAALACDHSEIKNTEGFLEAVIPHRDAPGIKVLERMVDRLGPSRFSIDLCSKGAGNFEYTDGLACYRIHPRSRRMARLVKQHGIDGTADLLLAELLNMDRARARCIGALETLLHNAGFSRHRMCCEEGWTFGRTHREFTFDPFDGLTAKLRTSTEADILTEWLTATNAVCPLPSRDELASRLDGPYENITERSLPVIPPSEGPSIAAFESLDLDALNLCADKLIAELRRRIETRQRLPGGDQPLWLWQDRLWYRRDGDIWADESWWMERARIRWRIDQDQTAALILLANGDEEPAQRVLRIFRDLGYYHNEACDDGLVWILKDRLPWNMELYGGMPEFPHVIGPLPAELARPHAVATRTALERLDRMEEIDEDYRDTLGDVFHHSRHLDWVTAREWLGDDDLRRLHRACNAWAGETNNFGFLEDGRPLEVAASFGWPDVVDTLEKNPVLFAAVLNDEYAPPDLSSYALRLSLAKPGAFAARFAAHIMSLDPEEAAASALPQECGRESSNMAKSIFKGYANSYRKARMAGAIAWNRCRSASGTTA